MWKHAIDSLSTYRAKNEILNQRYIQRLWDYCFEDYLLKYKIVESANDAILTDWLIFAKQCYSTKKPEELKIAYLCGPEPENDLKLLVDLGIRVENVWAFESDRGYFKMAIDNIRTSYPTLKIFNGRIETYLSISPAKFDIIYLDFTAPLFSASQKPYQVIHAVFDHQALNELGILIVNSCFPDKNEESIDFLASYFFNQKMLESNVLGSEPDEQNGGDFGEGVDTLGMYTHNEIKPLIERNFWHAYSAFASHYPVFYAALIQPMYHVLKNPLTKKKIFASDQALLAEKEQSFLKSEDMFMEWTEYSFINFLRTLTTSKTTLEWIQHYQHKEQNMASKEQAVNFMYMVRNAVYKEFLMILSDSLKNAIPKIYKSLPDRKGGVFCDVPMIHLWLELAINQFGYPHHCNVENHERLSYKAKTREMCLDIFTFDRCRALYDWLPMIEYYGEDLSIIERQMITRSCIDAIGKHRLFILDALYMGSALVCVNDRSWSGNHTFKERRKI